ncbi:LOW QUALITY PROTEIN: hypothetical protein C923_02926 [Plasmodium falciparum UGT5.1]|uniref:Uncharacterized protein n=3 Tax=Plasmodium falciparum TaxID=5833 RepID=A0A024X8K4_PLAFC|nr:LOW QUALITY PROTEIN: hypothetical protein PFFVO_02837 [Plasmodium falciparum Vietnam Oak-Knoll (FVO)]ETW61400.1 LOW QUALITY PROTEIN: hypothetical protein PFMC_02820 [Plasmodium falciparum CAMP/Malaysia]EWC76409.1 LOW QUALITY PROTEIN: hypothetical protein C923_02926 [Plasmodium falciparum UGT5.1]
MFNPVIVLHVRIINQKMKYYKNNKTKRHIYIYNILLLDINKYNTNKFENIEDENKLFCFPSVLQETN